MTDAPATSSIAVVTINWNGWRHTLDCLHALRASEGASWHLYLVDNASTDDSREHLRGLGPDVTLIEAATNGGWTGGNNLGLREALTAGHEHIFILNNDAFVEPDTLARLLAVSAAFSAEARRPILGPIHRGSSTRDYDFHAAARDPKTGIPAWIPAGELGSRLDRPLIETAYISGAAIFAHRHHFETIGLLDDRFYLNFDDTDWCRRAEKAGFPLLMVRDAAIRHIGSASIGGRYSPLQTYFLTRNRLLFADKHCSPIERLRLFRRCLWQARELAGKGSGWWPSRLMRIEDGPPAAFRRGLRDYLLRRFGDCPPEIRQWNAKTATAP